MLEDHRLLGLVGCCGRIYSLNSVAKIHFPTDIFSDHWLQRSRATRHTCTGIVFDTQNFFTTRGYKTRPKIHSKQHVTFLLPPPKRKYQSSCPSIGLAYEPIPCCSNCQILLATRYITWLSHLSTNRIFSSEDRCLNDVIFRLLNPR